jgi:hypothetical protein
MQRGELAVAELVQDLARLHVPLVVVGVGLAGAQRAECAQGEMG